MSDEPALTDKTSDTSMLKSKRDSIHQPCGPINPHIPVYTPPPVYVNPHIQQTYLKKELGVQPLAHLHYIQQPAYTAVVPKSGSAYTKPVTAVNYQTAHQSVPYIKPIMPIYQKPMLSYAPTYQKHYAPMHQTPIYNHHDVMSKIFYKKYEPPQIIYQKPVAHSSVHYTSKVGHVHTQVPYVKPAVHAPPTYIPTPVHDSIIVKPHCT